MLIRRLTIAAGLWLLITTTTTTASADPPARDFEFRHENMLGTSMELCVLSEIKAAAIEYRRE